MRFAKKEKRDLFFAWLIISLAFAILLSGMKFFFSFGIFLVSFLISGFGVGVGFLFHEIMHKYVAIKSNLYAEFHAFYSMLFLALLFSFFGFIIAAPGSVFIRGRITKEKNGKISLAGPMTNIVLAFLFLLCILFIKTGEMLRLFFTYGLIINSLLALFNLLPVPFFDGGKIYVWNKKIYFFSMGAALFLFLSKYFI